MAFSLFGMVFMSAAQRRLLARGVGVYTYHAIGNPPSGAADPFLYVPTQQFEQQLKQLVEENFKFATPPESVSEPGGQAKIVLTFDDGYSNVFQNALPLLKQYRAKAIEYLVGRHIGGRNEWMVRNGSAPEPLMDKAQVQDWLAAGQEIGSHTLTHANLTTLSPEAAREEIVGSKKLLVDLFAVPVRHFCYPGGAWNERVRDLVGEAGYETACTSDFGVNTPATHRHLLRRIIPLTRRELIGKSAHRFRRAIRR